MGRISLFIILGLIISSSFYFSSMNKAQMSALNSTLFHHGTIEARNISNSYAMSAVGELLIPGLSNEEKIEQINERYEKITPQKVAQFSKVSVTAEDNLMNPALAADEILITAIATITNVGLKNQAVTCTTTVLSRSFDYGDYALFVDDFNGKFLYDTERIQGDVHVNNSFGVNGDVGETGPIFDGNVSAVGNPYFGGALNEANFTGFHGSNEYGVPELDMPTFNVDPTTHPNCLNLANIGGNKRFITFLPNGDVLLSNSHYGIDKYYDDGIKGGGNTLITAAQMKNVYGGVIYGLGGIGNNAIHVEGVVNGNYTISSPNQIYITGNIVYNPDPRTNVNSESMLAIMTHDDVVTDWRYGVHSGTREELLLMANIFAEGTIRAGDHGKPADYGNLTVFGCRIQGLFTEFINNSHQGWHQQIIYDERLHNMRPPGFVFSGKMVVREWKDSI